MAKNIFLNLISFPTSLDFDSLRVITALLIVATSNSIPITLTLSSTNWSEWPQLLYFAEVAMVLQIQFDIFYRYNMN